MRFIRALSTSAPLFSHSNCPSAASFASPFRTSEVNRSVDVRRNNVHPKLRQKKCRSCRRRCHVDDLQRVVGFCLLELDGGRDNVMRALQAVTRMAPRRLLQELLLRTRLGSTRTGSQPQASPCTSPNPHTSSRLLHVICFTL